MPWYVRPIRYVSAYYCEAPHASDARTQVACFAIVMGFLGLIFFYIGISMGWLYVRDEVHGTTRVSDGLSS